jgi:hypothetical protein
VAAQDSTSTTGIQPSHPFARAFAGAILTAAVLSAGLLMFPGLLAGALFFAAPPLMALMVSGAPFDRDRFTPNGLVTAIAGGVTGAAWVIGQSAGDRHPVAIAFGAAFSLLVLSAVGALGAYVAVRIFGRGRDAREPDDDVDE